MQRIKGRLRFLSREEGGRVHPASSGVHSQLLLGDIMTSVVVSAEEGTVFEPGVDYDVVLEVRFWDQYGQLFDRAKPLQLYEGERLVAVGAFQ